MEHDIIVIKSNRIVDTDYTTRRLRDKIKETLKKLKEDREASKLAMVLRDKKI